MKNFIKTVDVNNRHGSRCSVKRSLMIGPERRKIIFRLTKNFRTFYNKLIKIIVYFVKILLPSHFTL